MPCNGLGFYLAPFAIEAHLTPLTKENIFREFHG